MADGMRTEDHRPRGSALGDALTVAYQTRIVGLASEASFWGVFALPWLFLALVAGVSQLQRVVDVDALDDFRDEILELAGEVLTPQAIDDLLVPLLDSILERGQAGLGLVGILVAIWAGSRVVDALVDGMTIVYRREGLRSFVKTRVVSVAVYVGGVLGLILAIPVVIVGPTFLGQLVPGSEGRVSSALLMVAQFLVALVLVVSLYHWSVPHRTAWRADIPGALIALGFWVVFSYLLRWYFQWLFSEGSVYGVISAPIAVMLWVFVTCLSLLLGAAFNGALAVRRGWFTPVEDTGSVRAASSST